jgi:osmotically-inducible protein OsmY
MRNKPNRKRTAVLALALALMVGGGGIVATNARSESGTTDSSNSLSRENDSVSVKAEHHYNSPAERANDALLIVEVKSALAHDGVADGYLVAVDCDHGKILLSGVMKSAQDAQHAGNIAARAPGVVAVKNQLSWH